MTRCSSRVHGQLVCLALACLWVAAARAQQTPITDPIEAAALNTILGRWGQKASPEWNISGEPCSGVAVDDTDIDNSPIINPGIKCDCSFNNGTVCHITKLRVYALDVVGQIPAELQNLTYLTNLNLQQNYLTGSVPAFIGELTALEYLSVQINALTGIVPRELGNLSNLMSLGISTNKFVGPLPEEIQNLTKLEQLYIDSCGLSGELPSTFSKLKNLKILWASDNDFTGKIPDYIGSLSNLEVLRFEGNNFDGPIPARLSNLVKLVDMRIGDLVSGSSSLAFVANMTSLYTLTLRNCRISDNLASVDFSIFENLTYLDFSFNSITGKVPPTLLNLNSLGFLFLGSNNLSGSLPDTKSPSLTTLDFSYNILLGRFPSWVNMNYSQVNLVWNNFVIDSSNSSVSPSGLNCLQRDTPCFPGSPEYSSFAVDSGGKRPIRGSDNSIYELDDANLQGASYYVTNSTRWGVSNIGEFRESPNGSNIIHTSHQFNNTLDSKLFQTARMSPSSLRYYGIGLKNGTYNVVLQFAEIFFPDTQTWQSLGRRIFNIYIQGELRERDFDIKKQTNGKSYSVVQKQYFVEVTRNFLEILLFWAGKGTCCIPNQGFYGPSISALSSSFYGSVAYLRKQLVPRIIFYYLTPTAGSNNEGDLGPKKNSSPKKNSKTGLVVGVVVGVAVLGFLALTGTFVWRQRSKRLEVFFGKGNNLEVEMEGNANTKAALGA